MFRSCFGRSDEEHLPLIVENRTNNTKKFICDFTDIPKSGIPTLLATTSGGFAAYGFIRYSQDLLQNYIGDGSYIAGYLCGVPIALLSGASGGKVITNFVTSPWDSTKSVGKAVITFGGWNRDDLRHRDLGSRPKWFVLQVANSGAGVVNFFATPLSVIASDALNFARSQTWVSTGPNTGSSFLMNSFYLKRTLDLFLDKFAAWLGDIEPEKRADLLKMLTGIKNELPAYANTHPEAFFAWLNDFVMCQDNQSKLIKLAELQTAFHEPKPAHYDTSWSVMGLIMLLPAAIFTLPLFRAGQKARTIFKDYSFIDLVIDIISWQMISASSLICNLMINSVNAYHFGSDIGGLINAIFQREFKAYISQMRWQDWVRIVCSVLLLASLAAIAQMGAAAENPILAVLANLETILVGIAALALYSKASSNYGTRVVNFTDRWRLRNTNDFAESYQSISGVREKKIYLDILVKIVQEHIEQVENTVQSAAYKSEDRATPFNIETLAANQEVINALESMPAPKPSWINSWCASFGKKATKPNEVVVNHAPSKTTYKFLQ